MLQCSSAPASVRMNHATTGYSHKKKGNFNQDNRIKSSPRGRNSDSFLACSALMASMADVGWFVEVLGRDGLMGLKVPESADVR